MSDKDNEEIELEKKIKRMNYRANKKKYLFYPESEFIDSWNAIISITIIVIAIIQPYRIAFSEFDLGFWLWFNRIIDLLFFFDILIIFNSALYDHEFNIIDDRKVIAKLYSSSWFIIDVVSIIPFDFFMVASNDIGNLAKIIRIGRLYKLLKLSRLLKIFKIIKIRGKLL